MAQTTVNTSVWEDTMEYVKDAYNTTMASADPLSSKWPLMESPHQMLILVGLYVLMCVQGPKYMEGSKPRNLREILIVYNFAVCMLNLFIFVGTARGLLQKGYSISCERLETYRNTPYEWMWLLTGWLFSMSKFIEFMDTAFLILGNKFSHVTFLHCYHHSLMSCFTWIGYKFQPGGPNVIYPLLNSFVHVVMYVYYGLSAVGPSMRKYLWWKRYLTILQMTQFVVYLGQTLINNANDCPIPPVFKYSVFFYTFTILLLFINFYVRAYIFKKREAKPVKNGRDAKPVKNGKKHH